MDRVVKHWWKLAVTACIILAAVLRFWQLGQLPGVLNRDEAGLAYNAFLLFHTGSDEWQRPWPLALESFGDFKLIGYPLAIVLSFFVTGISDWSVRLPSALGGVALIPLWIWWWRIMAPHKLHGSKLLWILGAFSCAVSPVFIWYSRSAYEANLALSYWVLLSCLLFSQTSSYTKRLLFDVIASGILVLAMSTYNTPLLLLPGLVVLLILQRGLTSYRTWIPTVSLLLVVWGTWFALLYPLTSQKSGITIFTDETVWAEWSDFRSSLGSPVLQRTLGNRVVYWIYLLMESTVWAFSPEFLVTLGGKHPWHALPGWGHIYSTTYFCALIGFFSSIYQVLKAAFSSYSKRGWSSLRVTLSSWSESAIGRQALLILLTFCALAPAGITVDAPHATRSLWFFFLLIGWSIVGLQLVSSILANFLKKSITSSTVVQTVVCSTFVLLLSLQTTHYYSTYLRAYPEREPDLYQKGSEQAFQKVEQTIDSSKTVAVVDPDGYLYVTAAWYLKMPAQQFHSTAQRQLPTKIGFRYVDRLGRFHFIAQATDRDPQSEPVLLQFDKPTKQWQLTEF